MPVFNVAWGVSLKARPASTRVLDGATMLLLEGPVVGWLSSPR